MPPIGPPGRARAAGSARVVDGPESSATLGTPVNLGPPPARGGFGRPPAQPWRCRLAIWSDRKVGGGPQEGGPGNEPRPSCRRRPRQRMGLSEEAPNGEQLRLLLARKAGRRHATRGFPGVAARSRAAPGKRDGRLIPPRAPNHMETSLHLVNPADESDLFRSRNPGLPWPGSENSSARSRWPSGPCSRSRTRRSGWRVTKVRTANGSVTCVDTELSCEFGCGIPVLADCHRRPTRQLYPTLVTYWGEVGRLHGTDCAGRRPFTARRCNEAPAAGGGLVLVCQIPRDRWRPLPVGRNGRSAHPSTGLLIVSE
ncbi:hypothetical protein QFZ82_007669 [Streptomyces sp. V4I23]|nr:hypothetical protein [Streptomyces sp. V4I23]